MGNPNPSPETRFVPGQSGNPGGKTSEHRKAEVKAAELAAKVQLDLVQALANAIEAQDGDQARIEHIRSDVLKLLKDAQDRGFGAPTQPVDNTSSDGSTRPSVIKIVAAPVKGD